MYLRLRPIVCTETELFVQRSTRALVLKSLGGLLFFFLLLGLSAQLLPSSALAQSEETAVPIGWESLPGPSGIFGSADEACFAQWKKFMDNGYSRYIGSYATGDDWKTRHCLWTQWQYLCLDENPGAGFKCGTIYPDRVRVVCPQDYIATRDGYCRLSAAAERPCDPCEEDGRTNPKIGNPVVISTGAKRLEALDYSSADGLFQISRQYRSFQVGKPIQQSVLPRALPKGLDGYWNFSFNLEIQLGVFAGSPSSPDATVAILMPDGTGYGFVLQPDGRWLEDPGAGAGNRSNNLKLEYVGTLPSDLGTVRDAVSTWKLTDRDDTVWTLMTRVGPNGGHHNFGWPILMEAKSGYQQTFTYAGDSSLSTISDSFGRTASFTWEQFEITTISKPPASSLPTPIRISSIDLPDGTFLNYVHEEVPPPDPVGRYGGSKWQSTWAGGSAPGSARSVIRVVLPKMHRLKSVERLSATDIPLDSVTYLYEHSVYGKNVTGIVDHRGVRVATYDYDSAGRTTLTQGAEGTNAKSVAYGMNGSARTRVVTHELGKPETYTFSEFSSNDKDYRLTGVTSDATDETEARSASLTYGTNTFIASTTDEEGRLTTVTRDARGRPISFTEASGTVDARTTTITWDTTFNVPTAIVAPGLSETRGYDVDGRLTSLTLTDATTHSLPYPTSGQTRTYTFSWDANGRLLSENGPLPASGSDDDLTSYAYDASGNLLTFTNPLGHVTTYGGYDANGRPGTVTDPNGVVSTFVYDLLGRLETVTIEHPTNPALNATTAMTYDEVGNLTQLTLPGTAPLIMEYDAANRLTVMRSASGERWEYTYDLMDNVERETVKRTNGSTSVLVRRQFDELGRLLRETFGTRSPAKFGYDKVNNLLQITDPNGFATTSSVDALDRVVSTVAPDGGSMVSTYDDQDNALTFTDPISVTTGFVYNGFGEVIEETSPDRGTSTYVYDASGLMTQSTDGRGQVVSYTRDFLGRVTRMEPLGRPASEVIEYHWDTGGLSGSHEIGRLAKVVDGSGTTLFRYDHRGNRTAKQQAIGTSATALLTYEYDVADRITQITYPSGRLVRYGYDAHGRVNLVETKADAAAPVWDTLASGHQYEPFGQIKSMALGNTLAVTNEWGTDGRLAARRLYPTLGGNDLSHLVYGRDAVGRIGAIADQVTPANSVLYGYDEVGRLIMAVSDGASAAGETYTYTAGTNRLESFTDASGTRSITYDGRGNTLSETRPGGIAVTATYDGYGRLASYDRTNIGAQSYAYNGLGDRVRVNKPTGTRHFVYDAWGRVIGEYGASALDVKAEFIWAIPPAANDNSPFGGGDEIAGFTPLALVAEDASNQLELYWVHGNHLGVPIVTTNAQGQVVSPGNDFLRPGFPGQSQVLSDLYYNRARDYDPVTGRYIQADPIGLAGDVNPYVYAGADPVNAIDPLGLFKGNPADFAPVRAPSAFATAGFGLAFLGYVSNEFIVPALRGALCPTMGPPNRRQFEDYGVGIGPDDDDDPCAAQLALDQAKCQTVWESAAPSDYEGYSKTEGIRACKRSAFDRYSECQARGKPRSPLSPVPGQSRRNRNIHGR
ncbi:RHS repeat domain-containing protein [Erythrobacter sp. GH1-10]|uniref:RHS repeat domain-containing protein n=1 Tax=Erythrobacter sp. GH1-10 TaxID=3349334 RepID=UPI003877EC7A